MIRQKSFENENPTLYLVATPIGNLAEMTPRAIDVLKEVDIIAAEDTRNTMKLLSHFEISTRCIAHHMHNEYESAKGLLQLLDEGKNVAVVSDAGYPLVSDPGQVVVNMVVEAGYNVVPISGANAALNALVASGLPAQPFMFVGFIKGNESEKRKECLEISKIKHTMIFYEAPHKLSATLKDLYAALGDRRIAIVREITKIYEETIRTTLKEASERYSKEQPKGEIVLVIEGANKEKEKQTIEDAFSLANSLVESGESVSEAAKKAAAATGFKKSDIYKMLIGQRG